MPSSPAPPRGYVPEQRVNTLGSGELKSQRKFANLHNRQVILQFLWFVFDLRCLFFSYFLDYFLKFDSIKSNKNSVCLKVVPFPNIPLISCFHQPPGGRESFSKQSTSFWRKGLSLDKREPDSHLEKHHPLCVRNNSQSRQKHRFISIKAWRSDLGLERGNWLNTCFFLIKVGKSSSGR